MNSFAISARTPGWRRLLFSQRRATARSFCSANYLRPHALILVAGLLSGSAPGQPLTPELLKHEAFLFTPAGFEREGQPVWASGEKTGRLQIVVRDAATGQVTPCRVNIVGSDGAAFCGEDPPYLPGFAPAQAFPYNACVDVDKMVDLIAGFFDLSDEEKALPLTESTKAYVTAARIGPLPILWDDGTEVEDDFLLSFFPGEVI